MLERPSRSRPGRPRRGPPWPARCSTWTWSSAAASSSASSPVPSGLLSSATRTSRVGHGGADPADDPLDVLALVVGRDDDQDAAEVGRSRSQAVAHARAPPAADRSDRRGRSAAAGGERRRGEPDDSEQPLGPAAPTAVGDASVASRSGTVPPCSAAGELARCAGAPAPSGGDDRADPAGRGDEHGAAVLDRPQPRHRQLLLGLRRCGRRSRCWSARRATCAPPSHDVADEPVVGDLEADHVADAAPARPAARPGSCPATKSRGIRSSRRDHARSSWPRNGMYSPNGTGCRLT